MFWKQAISVCHISDTLLAMTQSTFAGFRSIAVNIPTVSADTWIQRSYQSAQYHDNPDPQFSRVKDRGTLIYIAD